MAGDVRDGGEVKGKCAVSLTLVDVVCEFYVRPCRKTDFPLSSLSIKRDRISSTPFFTSSSSTEQTYIRPPVGFPSCSVTMCLSRV